MNKRQKEVLQAQLDAEKKTLRELKQVYSQALKDCETKIRELSARTDMENLQSIIYQKQYQEALKAQLEGVLTALQSNSYATISEYLTQCYKNGYIGAMYDIHGQGIPVIMPIDQKAVTRAIQTDSKISKGLYNRLGEDVGKLKTSIRAELSRGIANGSSWNEVAGKLSKSFKNTPFSTAFSRAMLITRTEGHRVQVQSAMDAQQEAKDAGADVLKQWDAALDDRTRETHRMLDGQIRELNEPFEVGGKKADAPGMFGDPAEDCNCRCALLQRARWALDEEELKTLQERAEYFGLDKSTDFEDFRKKYIDASEKEQSKRKYLYSDTIINKKVIESPEYRRRFNQVSGNAQVNRKAWQFAKEMLEHRSGTRYEDLAFIDSDTGKGLINKNYDNERMANPSKAMMKMLNESADGTVIAMHNHPGSSIPSIPDLKACIQRKYMKGIIVCHDGKIYVYSVNAKKYNDPMAISALDRLEKSGYTENVKKRLEDAGVTLEVL